MRQDVGLSRSCHFLAFRLTIYDSSKLNAAKSPLLRLPAEIRNTIYDKVLRDLVFELGEPIPVLKYDYDEGQVYTYYDTIPHDRHRLSLLRVCRQLYRETSLLLYQLAIFEFGLEVEGFFHSLLPHTLVKFLVNRSREKVEAISRIRVYQFDMTYGTPTVVGHELRTGLYWSARLGL